MTKIFELVKYRNRDCILVLDYVLSLAERGDLRGLAICYANCDGDQDPIFAGTYKTRPSDALQSVMKLSWQLTQHSRSGNNK